MNGWKIKVFFCFVGFGDRCVEHGRCKFQYGYKKRNWVKFGNARTCHKEHTDVSQRHHGHPRGMHGRPQRDAHSGDPTIYNVLMARSTHRSIVGSPLVGVRGVSVKRSVYLKASPVTAVELHGGVTGDRIWVEHDRGEKPDVMRLS